MKQTNNTPLKNYHSFHYSISTLRHIEMRRIGTRGSEKRAIKGMKNIFVKRIPNNSSFMYFTK